MIEPSVVKKLKTYDNVSFQILSVYLGADTLQAPSGEFLLTQFHSLLHRHLSRELQVTFESDIQRIEAYLREYVPSARSIVFFTAGQALWETVHFEFFLPTSLTVGTSPNISPVLTALQKYSKYLVLLVDREKARMFTVEQGTIVDHSEFIGGYVPPRKKATGRDGVFNQSDTNFRHNEELLRRHVDLATEAAVAFTKTNNIHFVILGGHAEMFKKVAKSLPAPLQAKIVGSFITDVNLPLNDILQASKKIAASIGEPDSVKPGGAVATSITHGQ